jgi:hypothetical protein
MEEDNNRPVDFDHVHLNITELHSCREDPMLQKDELMELVHKKLMQSQYQDLLPRGQVLTAVKVRCPLVEACKRVLTAVNW